MIFPVKNIAGRRLILSLWFRLYIGHVTSWPNQIFVVLLRLFLLFIQFFYSWMQWVSCDSGTALFALHFYLHERVQSLSKVSLSYDDATKSFCFPISVFFLHYLFWILGVVSKHSTSGFLFWQIYMFFVTQIFCIFAWRISIIGYLKIWCNGVHSAAFCCLFPGDKSVAGYCNWLVSCTGWHINIGRRFKEESESGYKLIKNFVPHCPEALRYLKNFFSFVLF